MLSILTSDSQTNLKIPYMLVALTFNLPLASSIDIAVGDATPCQREPRSMCDILVSTPCQTFSVDSGCIPSIPEFTHSLSHLPHRTRLTL